MQLASSSFESGFKRFVQRLPPPCGMPARRKLLIAAGAASLVAIAWAATTWGPFFMKPYFPNVTFEHDMETHFMNAGNVPRLVMNKSVTSIEKGHRVRVVYPDGTVWDFEVQYDCPIERICSFENPVKAASLTAPTQPTNYEIAYWRQDTCPWDSGYKDIPTGYWASKTVQTGENEFTQSAWYVSTGTKSVYINGAGCK